MKADGRVPLVAGVDSSTQSTKAVLCRAALDELSALALAAEPGAGGVTLLPYLDGERTPDRPDATGVLAGLTTSNATRENVARTAVEALLCSLADAVGHLAARGGVRPRRTLLIGGGARSAAVRALAPAILGTPVTVPEPAEYVALGAARQAAWALAGTPRPPAWPAPPATEHTGDGADAAEIRERYAALRDSAPRIGGRTP
ncbi:FGGY-family carbohydrate kinase [Actinomadura soli]|uniref:FGGY-family carbohydrate kinase n=1 Tax=Actinomadura soli TaxID=2508997 RepID=UPI001E3EE07A|nr:FGGY-family carbohydrate kinase [Actinomadura soli]